jgi:hypothetical protein
MAETLAEDLAMYVARRYLKNVSKVCDGFGFM